jgi:hypothetical protein
MQAPEDELSETEMVEASETTTPGMELTKASRNA